ncbi:MAG: PQQ-binding-like beta-propeller repeat protein [Planctomycetales bacterium]|nr:PQQ-binding-like beta-propeller repeat protein [Planctomycetales bacterium]
MSASFRRIRVLALLLIWCTACLPCWSQIILPGNGDDVDQNYGGVYLPSDRTLSRGVQQARKRISEGEYTRAVRFLDELLDPSKEDSFINVGNAEEFAGLKATSRQILRDLPLEGRQAYETSFAPIAHRELLDGIESGDFDVLRQVSQRYFYTPAGYEAALLLATHEADMGRHFAAALTYQQLIDTPEAADRFQPQLSLLAASSWMALGDQAHALKLIEDLRDAGYRSVSIAGEEFRLDSMGKNPLEWLQQIVGSPEVQAAATEDQWLTLRGNAARNGQVEGGLPHMRVHWQVRLLSHHKLESLHDDLTADLLRGKKTLPVAAAPLAVGNHIITRSAHNLVAVDFRTGKLIWQAEPQRVPEFDELCNGGNEASRDQSSVEPVRAFSNRIWEDHLYNSLSSDGQRVYAIRDLPLATQNANDLMAMPFMNGQFMAEGPASTNRLCAFDLATQGKLVWEIDGAAAKDQFEGAFFLGAPLAVGDALYAIVEMKSAVYLAAIDQHSGQLMWRQQLANLETGIVLDPQRRLQASVPSYDGGILVCPTGAGVVVGLDLAKNSLAWAYRYDTAQDPRRSFRARSDRESAFTSRWIDSFVSIADGRILLTPPESDSLHCLDLVSGKLLWKRPREEYLFVAGIYQSRALLVGNNQLTAIRLEDGQPVWQDPHLILPEDALPSGRGFFSKGQYFLPLTTAEVVAIDLEQGAIVDRSVSRDGQVLGNLICHHGAVLSQSGSSLDRFDQIDVLREESQELLADDRTNAEALRTLGEIAYNEGQLSQAIDLLHQAYNSAPEDLRTREVLAEALVIALDEDFASYRNRLPLLQELHEAPGVGPLTLLRLEAHGLLVVGDPVGAFRVCLALYAEEPAVSELLTIGRHHQVEVLRWIREQSTAIWEQADETAREQISALLQELVQQLPEQPGGAEYLRLMQGFAELDGIAPVKLRLARQYLADQELLAAQQLYLQLAESTDPTVRSEAIAGCSLVLHQANLPQLARPFDAILRTSLADVVCLDGKTGREFLSQWNDAAAKFDLPWPYGKVEVHKTSPLNSVSPSSVGHQSSILMERSDKVLAHCEIMFSTAKGEIGLRDSFGKEFFRTLMSDPSRRQGHGFHLMHAVGNGNLLVISTGPQLVAYNTLSQSDQESVEPLWQRDVTSALAAGYQGAIASQHNDRPGTNRVARSQIDGKWVGVIGPVTHDSCVFQDQRKLICVDSQTGELRWTRSDVPPGCDLYGDHRYVFAVPRSSKSAFVYSTIDGRSLGQVSVPGWNEQLATLGRNVIRWRSRPDGRRELSCFDAFAEKTLWKYDFEKTAEIDVAAGSLVAVVETSGHCTIVDASDGRRLVDQPIASSLSSKDVHLLAGSDRLVLAIHKPVSARTSRRIGGLNQFDYALIDGLIYVFDRHSGKPAWKSPAEVREQALLLTQPVDAPIIAFVGNLSHRDNRGSQQRISMLLLEKASGRLLFQDDALPPSRSNYCSVEVSDSNPHEVIVKTSGQFIQLSFTDLKRPPEPPAMEIMEADLKNGKEGLQGIIRKLIERGS